MELKEGLTRSFESIRDWEVDAINKIQKELEPILQCIGKFVSRCLRRANPRVYTLMRHKKKRVAKKNRNRFFMAFYRLQGGSTYD